MSAARALPSIDDRDARIAKLGEQVVFLAALCRSLNDRIAALEGVESAPIDRARQ